MAMIDQARQVLTLVYFVHLSWVLGCMTLPLWAPASWGVRARGGAS